MSYPDRISPGPRPVASEHPRAPRGLVAVACRSGWLCGCTSREIPTPEHCRLLLPSRPLPSNPMLSWNHVSFDVPITGRATAAESSPSPRPRPGRLAGQDRPGRHGSAASLPCGSGVAPPRSQPKLRRLRARLRSQVSPPAHTHKHVPHERPTLHAAMSGGDGLPPSSLGIAGRPEEATANNIWGKPLILTVACATWGKPR